MTTRELSMIIILSALGGAVSVPIGYSGSFLSTLPFLPFGSSQILSGLHVLWLLLAGLLVRKAGVGTLTGLLKGLVELTLFSFHSFLVLPISAVEGAAVDAALIVLGRKEGQRLYLAGGLSSASNVVVLRFTFLQNLPDLLMAYMFAVSFVSGAVLAGYLGGRALKILGALGTG